MFIEKSSGTQNKICICTALQAWRPLTSSQLLPDLYTYIGSDLQLTYSRAKVNNELLRTFVLARESCNIFFEIATSNKSILRLYLSITIFVVSANSLRRIRHIKYFSASGYCASNGASTWSSLPMRLLSSTQCVRNRWIIACLDSRNLSWCDGMPKLPGFFYTTGGIYRLLIWSSTGGARHQISSPSSAVHR